MMTTTTTGTEAGGSSSSSSSSSSSGGDEKREESPAVPRVTLLVNVWLNHSPIGISAPPETVRRRLKPQPKGLDAALSGDAFLKSAEWTSGASIHVVNDDDDDDDDDDDGARSNSEAEQGGCGPKKDERADLHTKKASSFLEKRSFAVRHGETGLSVSCGLPRDAAALKQLLLLPATAAAAVAEQGCGSDASSVPDTIVLKYDGSSALAGKIHSN